VADEEDLWSTNSGEANPCLYIVDAVAQEDSEGVTFVGNSDYYLGASTLETESWIRVCRG